MERWRGWSRSRRGGARGPRGVWPALRRNLPRARSAPIRQREDGSPDSLLGARAVAMHRAGDHRRRPVALARRDVAVPSLTGAAAEVSRRPPLSGPANGPTRLCRVCRHPVRSTKAIPSSTLCPGRVGWKQRLDDQERYCQVRHSPDERVPLRRILSPHQVTHELKLAVVPQLSMQPRLIYRRASQR